MRPAFQWYGTFHNYGNKETSLGFDDQAAR